MLNQASFVKFRKKPTKEQGSKPDFAMAGIKDASKVDEALAAVAGIVRSALNG